jgi:hypothetical protein
MAIHITKVTFTPSGADPAVGTLAVEGTATTATVQVKLGGADQAAAVAGGTWSARYTGVDRSRSVHLAARVTQSDGSKRKSEMRFNTGMFRPTYS